MTNYKQGFIPLVVAIALGIIAITGGTALILSPKKGVEKRTVSVATTTLSTSSPSTVASTTNKTISKGAVSPVLPSVKHSAPVTITTKVVQVQVPVKQIKADVPNLVILDSQSQKICDEISKQPSDSSQRSLVEDTRVLCELIPKGRYQGEGLKTALNTLKKNWKLWQLRLSYERHLEGTANTNTEIKIEPTSLPEEKPQEETYKESDTYPIILSFTDNHGITYKGSMYNGYQGPFLEKKGVTLHAGDTIRATVQARDPKGRALEYNWNSNSTPFNDAVGIENGKYKYTSNNQLTYTLTEADLRSTGETFRLVWSVRVAGTDFYRFGGGGYDDSGFIDYTLTN